jgi:hypothetical protein
MFNFWAGYGTVYDFHKPHIIIFLIAKLHGEGINIKHTNIFTSFPKGSKQINIKSIATQGHTLLW